jgi:hypothetical protein
MMKNSIRILKTIPVNIWDDYYDDGYEDEGEVQETYAYVETDEVSEEDCQAILVLLNKTIEKLLKPSSKVQREVVFYDSAKDYPNLIGTEHEHFLFKRWQLNFTYLTHREREALVEDLEKQNLSYNNIPLKIYSES